MSQPNLIRIAPVGESLVELAQEGRKYSESWEDGLTREDRAASGKLRRDVIARKKNFSLSYELCDEATVQIFESAFQYNTEITLEVTHLTTTRTYTVLMLPFSRDRLLAVWGGMWEGVTAEFREV